MFEDAIVEIEEERDRDRWPVIIFGVLISAIMLLYNKFGKLP